MIGKSGWYEAPGGDLFYFVRDESADWLLAAGPISKQEYEMTIFNTTTAGVLPITAATAASGSAATFAMMKKTQSATATSTYALPYSPGDILRKCNFELKVEHDAVKGDLYVANKSNKLYIAVSVDTVLLEYQYAYSTMNDSSLANENDTIGSISYVP